MDKTVSQKTTTRAGWLALSGLVSCCLVTTFFMVCPPVYGLDAVLMIWPIGGMHGARWGILAGLLVLVGGSGWLVRRAAASNSLEAAWRRWIWISGPLSWLPVGTGVSFLADLLPVWVVSNVLFYFPVLVVSVVVTRLMAGTPPERPDERSTRRWALWLLAGTTVAFTAIGWYLSGTTGEHAGDEGHYLIQAKSLFFDHDLDIKNNFLAPGQDPATVNLYYIHISPQSKDGHWYSWHPYGLSLVLAPFWPGGMPLRQFILGLISGIGCAGMFLLSRRMGASLRSSLVAVLGLAGSLYWALYSARSLPEVFGASLLIWVFWAIAAQKDKPWSSALVAAGCCVYLPFAHLRFLPLSLMGAGVYGLYGLCSAGPWRPKIIRLMVFSLLNLAGAAVFFGIQRNLFASGSSYPVSDVLFSYPLGAWAVLADSRGVAVVFPLFLWLVPAWIAWLVTDRQNRWFSLALGATFLACLLTSCTNDCYPGGSSIPGRYALVVVPLLIPAAACMLDRVSSWARWWFVFLGLVGLAILTVVLVRLPDIGRAFTLPVETVASHPVMKGLFRPHSMFLEGTASQIWLTSLYVVMGMTVGLWLMMAGARRKAGTGILFILLGAVGIVSHGVAKPDQVMSCDPGHVAGELSKINLERALVIRLAPVQPLPLLDLSCDVFRDVQNPERRPRITTRDLGVRRKEFMISQPRLEENDWNGRKYRWTTITVPFSPERGQKLIRIRGRVTGTAKAVFAIREGSRTWFEGALVSRNGIVEGHYVVPFRGKSGHLYFLVRLENGEGDFYLDDLCWSPYSERLLRTANLQLPESTAILRQ